ncbi:MAG: ABC transporter ATP-binding protein [Clostridiales bacterium]|nr:ABC transporter ATP-binding protein [Clostridiales bacterium]
MKFIFRSIARYKWAIALAIFLKLLGTMFELLLPYILEHMVDHVVPSGQLGPVIFWGLMMFVAAVLCRQFNVAANRKAIFNAHRVSYDVRQALFEKTINLSGHQFDFFGLPSLISRMTSDSYNVQSSVQQLQSLCVRAPIMLVGGLIMTLSMDRHLAMILVVMVPFLLAVVLFVSSRGIPLFTAVQQRLDTVVRIMRENITGIRVVKALSKTEYEKRRFAQANREMVDSDIRASSIMAIPGPFMQLSLNVGLVLVIIPGGRRVNAGEMQPGVILAFLTYFNMITMGVMGLNRIFMTMSRASASANRIASVLKTESDQHILPPAEAKQPTERNSSASST